jgi:hypothetical protein
MVLLVVAVLFACLVAVWLADSWRRRQQHLPPGPKSRPFLGNFHELPEENMHVYFRDLGNVYGMIHHQDGFTS